MTLGERLKLMVKTSEHTVDKFTELVSTSRTSFFNWANGTNKPDLENILSIIKAYPEYNPRWILLGEGEMKLPPQKTDVVEEPLPKYGNRPLTKTDLSKILKKLADEIDRV